MEHQQTAISVYDKKHAARQDREEASTGLASYVKDIFESFKAARLPWEEIWQECWNNYLGQYQQDTVWRKESEGTGSRSRVFIKLTTLKCHAAHSKIVDAMFSGDRGVPFSVEPVLSEMLGIPIEKAKEIANTVKKQLQGHFRFIELDEILDNAILEMAILGTGVLKGPIIDMRRRTIARERMLGNMPMRELDASVNPYELVTIEESLPIISHVPLWEYYVDPNAKSTRDSIGEIHFTRLLPAQFKLLAYQGGYDADAVKDAAERAWATDENDKRYIQLGDNWAGEIGDKDERVSHLEYWGLVPVELMREHGCEIPDDIDDTDSIESLVALGADGVVIKACVNPIGRRPFFVSPYKKRPHIIYGQGVAEAMRDSQKMINSSARLIVDNKALSGNGMVGVNIDRINTKRTRDFKVYPGKTWYVKGNFSPRDAVDAVTFPDITHGLRELMEMFERFADEETGIPKYTTGEQGSFLNKTATGMSMLMTQANLNLKTVMKNVDDYWIEPIVEAFYAWMTEMGDMQTMPLIIKATGSDSLIAKEIRLENYMKFMQISASPQDAIFMDRVKLMKNISRLLETEDIMRPDEEIKGIMQEMTRQATGVKNLRESIAIDRLYPLLTRQEQMQVLQELGIQPDTQPQTAVNPKEQLELAAMEKKLQMEGLRLQTEIDLQNKKLDVEREKVAQEIALKREEVSTKAQIEREKAQIDTQIKARESDKRLAIEEKRVDMEGRRIEAEAKTVPVPAPVPQAAQPIHVHIDSKKGLVTKTTNGKIRKKVRVQKDEKGDIVGAEIEEENE